MASREIRCRPREVGLIEMATAYTPEQRARRRELQRLRQFAKRYGVTRAVVEAADAAFLDASRPERAVLARTATGATLTMAERCPDGSVRRALLDNPAASPGAIFRLVKEGNPAIWEKALRHPSISEKALWFIASSGRPRLVHGAVERMVDLGVNVDEFYVSRDARIRALVARQTKNPAVHDRLTRDRVEAVILAAIANPRASATASHLVKNRRLSVRVAVAAKTKNPTTLARLVEDSEPAVSVIAAKKLGVTKLPSKAELEAILEKRNPSRAEIVLAYEAANPEQRIALSIRPSAPVAMKARHFKKWPIAAREIVAETFDPDEVGPEFTKAILASKEPRVWEALADNRNLDRSIRDDFVKRLEAREALKTA